MHSSSKPALADIDRDGDIDMISAERDYTGLYFYSNNGNYTYTTYNRGDSRIIYLASLSSEDPRACFGDIDGIGNRIFF